MEGLETGQQDKETVVEGLETGQEDKETVVDRS